jgi:hypothetical protein
VRRFRGSKREFPGKLSPLNEVRGGAAQNLPIVIVKWYESGCR